MQQENHGNVSDKKLIKYHSFRKGLENQNKANSAGINSKSEKEVKPQNDKKLLIPKNEISNFEPQKLELWRHKQPLFRNPPISSNDNFHHSEIPQFLFPTQEYHQIAAANIEELPQQTLPLSQPPHLLPETKEEIPQSLSANQDHQPQSLSTNQDHQPQSLSTNQNHQPQSQSILVFFHF